MLRRTSPTYPREGLIRPTTAVAFRFEVMPGLKRIDLGGLANETRF